MPEACTKSRVESESVGLHHPPSLCDRKVRMVRAEIIL